MFRSFSAGVFCFASFGALGGHFNLLNPVDQCGKFITCGSRRLFLLIDYFEELRYH